LHHAQYKTREDHEGTAG